MFDDRASLRAMAKQLSPARILLRIVALALGAMAAWSSRFVLHGQQATRHVTGKSMFVAVPQSSAQWSVHYTGVEICSSMISATLCSPHQMVTPGLAQAASWHSGSRQMYFERLPPAPLLSIGRSPQSNP